MAYSCDLSKIETWTIMDYQGLSWTIIGYHRLSWAIMGSHGLYWRLEKAKMAVYGRMNLQVCLLSCYCNWKTFFFNKLDGWTFVNPSCSLSFNIVLYLTIFWNQWIIDLSICLHQQPSPTKFFLKKKILFKINIFVILVKMWKHTANTRHFTVAQGGLKDFSMP